MDELEAWSANFAKVDAKYKECLRPGDNAHTGLMWYMEATRLDRCFGRQKVQTLEVSVVYPNTTELKH